MITEFNDETQCAPVTEAAEAAAGELKSSSFQATSCAASNNFRLFSI